MSDTRLTIFTDGGARGNPGPSAIGVTVLDQTKTPIYELSQTIGEATNNEAEYQAFLASILWLTQTKHPPTITHVDWRLDSKLVVEQLNRRWKVKEKRLLPTIEQIWSLLASLPYSFTIVHVPRELNRRADALVNQALDGQILNT
jgi:ribonuclease HI